MTRHCFRRAQSQGLTRPSPSAIVLASDLPLAPPIPLLVLELIGLLVAFVPTGALLLRLAERLLGRPLPLQTVERTILSFYVAGALLFILASVPVPIYGSWLVVGVLALGAAGYGWLVYRERGSGPRSALAFVRTSPGALLVALTVGLLAVEVAGAVPLVIGNTLDGSIHSLFVLLLLRNHTLPWTLSPYASVGVTYPQGAPVWMSAPVVLFGWPIVWAPIYLPPIFLALSAPAGFCLGSRLAQGVRGVSASWAGLLCASFFALVANWPRLWIGGSFDFAFGLGLFLVLIGLIVTFARASPPRWGEVVAFAALVGIEFSLSLMLGAAAVLLLAAYILFFQLGRGSIVARWFPRWLTVVAISAGFLTRSLVGIAVWFSYPGHVLTAAGQPPYAPSQTLPTLSYRYSSMELNPFVLFKPKLSPFPWVSLEVAILLGAGLVLGLMVVVSRTAERRSGLPRDLVAIVFVGTLTMALMTAAILIGDATTGASGILTVSNPDEASAALFLFYELLAVIPLLAAAAWLADASRRPSTVPARVASSSPRTFRSAHRGARVAVAVLVGLVLIVPLGTGLATTAVEVSGYITTHIEQLANVTPRDLVALEWAGVNLPPCSRVLVAPGSVGQYLPEFATLSVVFPAFPSPANLSYYLVNEDLVAGNFTNSTEAALVELGVTEVLVSGQNSVSYLPFQLAPLLASPDFDVLEQSGDVTILEFLPGTAGSGCVP